MQKPSQRSIIWGSMLLALLLANLVIHWPGKKRSGEQAFPGSPLGMDSPAEMRAQFDAALQKLPEDQRSAVTKRMEEDRAFFDSVKNLPEQERVQKTQEHLAQNPPLQVPGMPAPPVPSSDNAAGAASPAGGPGGAGGPGDGGPQGGHIPEPGVRRSMDQQIATP